MRFETLWFVLGAVTIAGAQNNLGQEIYDDTTLYSAFFTHDSLSTNHGHIVDYKEEWEIWGFFTCFGEPFVDDKFAFSICAKHILAPHGEAQNPWASCSVNIVLPNDHPSDPRIINIIGKTTVIPHATHFDLHLARGTVRLAYLLGKADIAAYNLMKFGVHTDDAEACLTIDADSLRENVLGITDDESVGSLMGCYDAPSGNLRLSMAVEGMPLANLVRARLHVGGPNTNGPPVVDLGGPAEWTDLGNGYLRREMEFPLDPQLVPLVMSGQVYVQFTTVAHPNGATRGQLRLMPYRTLPETVQVHRGLPVGGSLTSSWYNDDERLEVQRFVVANTAEDPVQMEFTTHTPLASPSRISLEVEASGSTPLLRQTVLLFNHQTQQFVPVDSRNVTGTDSSSTVTVGSPQAYVGPDRSVRVRLHYRPSGPVNNSLWQARVDALELLANR